MRPFSFVHAADLHLDSPFVGLTRELEGRPEIAASLRAASFDAFEAVIDICLEQDVDFLLVAGDVYDADDRSLRAQLRFRDGLQRLADGDIRTFVVHGNHDPFAPRQGAVALPDAAHVFGARKVRTIAVETGGEPVAAISGVSHGGRREERNLAAGIGEADAGLFHIALLHANVGGDTGHANYAPCQLADLAKAKVDYWALGHVHQHAVLHRNPLVVYPGCTQGRSIREAGARGCCLVRVDADGAAAVEFQPVDAVRWLTASIDIEGLERLDQLEQRMLAAVEALADPAEGRPLLCRLEIVGRGELYPQLVSENVVHDLLEQVRERSSAAAPFVWIEGLRSCCLPLVDLAERRQGVDLLGQVLRAADELRQSPAMAATLLDQALGELYRDGRGGKVLDEPTPEELTELLAEAEVLCAHLLEEDEA